MSPETPGSFRHINILLLLGSMAITFCVFEAVARIFLPSPLPWLYPQVRYRPDPLLLFALRPNQDVFTADKRALINSHGLRGEPIPYERSLRSPRIEFLGDSIVFGYGIRNAETVSSRTRRLLIARGIPSDTLNTGVPSYNTEQEATFLEQEGLRYRPDWVVVGVCWNDINDKLGIRVSGDGWLISAGERESERFRSFGESPAGYALRNALKRSRLLYAVSQGLRVMQGWLTPDSHALFRDDVLEGRDTPQVSAGWNLMARAMERLRAVSVKGGFRVLVVAFPLPIKLESDYPHCSFPSRLEAIVRSNGLFYLDLEPAFRADYHGHDSLFIPYDGDHPNAAGHDLAARAISQFLIAHGVASFHAPE